MSLPHRTQSLVQRCCTLLKGTVRQRPGLHPRPRGSGVLRPFDKFVLIAFGDSNTTGFYVGIEHSWMTLAAQALGTTWITLGIDSSTLQEIDGVYGSGHSRRQLLWSAMSQHPDSYAVLYPGTADAVFAKANSVFNPDTYAEQLRNVLSGLCAERTRIILPNTMPDYPLCKQYQDTTRSVACDLGFDTIDASTAVAADGIHHNAAVHRKIATELIQTI